MKAERRRRPGRAEGAASIDSAVEAGLAFIASVQRPGGDIPVFTSTDPRMADRSAADPSVFPTALAAHCLAFAGPAARPILDRAHRFLVSEMDGNGLWRHWSREHPLHRQLPPDLDDTSCATAALSAAGFSLPDNRALMAANRNRERLFLTWIVPRAGRFSRVLLPSILPQLRHLPTLIQFFRKTSASPGDVDAVANANVLHCLGTPEGLEPVVRWLLEILRRGTESRCDKWYESPLVVRYFLSRALARTVPEAGELVLARCAAAEPANALEAAMLASTLLDWAADVPKALVDRLLRGQAASGAWPAAALYHGGRARIRGGGFAKPLPGTPYWGSEALSTAFAVEALARLAAARRGSGSQRA